MSVVIHKCCNDDKQGLATGEFSQCVLSFAGVKEKKGKRVGLVELATKTMICSENMPALSSFSSDSKQGLKLETEKHAHVFISVWVLEV